MIASASRLTDSHYDAYLGTYSTPKRSPQPLHSRRIEARYDAASSSTEFSRYWANADSLDSDTANSKGVRQRLVTRARYEADNNGYTDGILQTHCNYLVSVGPVPRIATGNAAIDALFRREWDRWSKATQFRRKLWCLAHAKTQDGESFGLIVRNQRVRHDVKLDLRLLECDQVTTPLLPYRTIGHIDGITFDSYGNAVSYDILPEHPGGLFSMLNQDPIATPARYVCHWFQLRRPGQHRGVPELKSTLQVGASSRRWREATVAAAESAADFAVCLATDQTPDELDAATPFTTFPVEKRMFSAMPQGYKPYQLEAKHPNATYADFHRQQISEQGRPKSMPYNLAACDSSNHNYASGKLDREAYYVQLDVEREDASDLVLSKVAREFALELETIYRIPRFRMADAAIAWDWPSHPVADVESETSANDRKLKNGSASLSRVYQEAGENFDVEVERMAADYGVTVEEMRRGLFLANFNDRNQQAGMAQASAQAAAVGGANNE